MNEPTHPIQPLIYADCNVIRFKENRIVRWLLDAGPFDLNTIGLTEFPMEDRIQFSQLIGYSLDGFFELISTQNSDDFDELEAKLDLMETELKNRAKQEDKKKSNPETLDEYEWLVDHVVRTTEKMDSSSYHPKEVKDIMESIHDAGYVIVPRTVTSEMIDYANGWTDLGDMSADDANRIQATKAELRMAWDVMVEHGDIIERHNKRNET